MKRTPIIAAMLLLLIPLAAVAAKPVKVFVLAGQSNMEGQAVVDLEGKNYNEGRGTLAMLMRDPAKVPMLKHLRGTDGKWTVRDDVWVRYQREERPLLAGPLGVGFAVYGGAHHFGPELQFGHVVGDHFENQVLLIKTAWGGKSLFRDFRPPSSGGEVGKYYTLMIAQVREALAKMETDFPATRGCGYELAGFVWYQGWNDGVNPKTAVPEYEQNLVNLIHDVRAEFKSPKLPVVIGELTGPWVKGPPEWERLRKAQADAAARPEFAGNVLFVPTRDFVRKPEDSPNPSHGHHEFGNAETYFLVGDALGKGMLKLIAQQPNNFMSHTRKLLVHCVVAFGLASTMHAAETRQQLASGWEHYQGSLGSTWEVWRGDKASDNVTWSPVTLPHCFNGRDAVDPDVRYYQGPGWYRTQLKVANPFPNGRTLLHFNGAGQKSQVFVHTEKVGEHVGGYDEWTVDITEAAAKALKNEALKGAVPLAVMCDNSRDAESIPSDLSDFNRYGGLYRHVSLVYAPAISVERVHVEAKVEGGKATVKVRSRLFNPTALKDEVELALEVRDAKDKIVHSATQKLAPWSGAKEIGAFEIAKPELWSPKSPVLYRCVVTLKSRHGEQQTTERFGVRSFEWIANGPFKLNGERLLLKGTHYHEDHAGVAAAVPDDVVRKTLAMIKDMGANFVRLGHYQQAPLVLDLCDELGLLVWEEVPWCRGGVGGERYKQQARDMQHAMIDQHYNHPSIIMWGLGNENDWPGDFEEFDKDKIRAFMTELNTRSHELDPSRPTCIRRCDFCKDIVDVYSPSIWAGWYSGRYTEYRASAEKALKDTKHFFHAEWGGDSHARRFAEEPEKMVEKVAVGQGTAEKGKAYKGTGGKVRMSKDGDWSESYMCNLFDWHLKEQEEMPWLTGSAQWIFKDFATPLRPENPVPRVNQKGVVERDGTPKETYYVFQSYWSDKPMLRIFGHNWPVRWGAAGEEKEIRVYSNCGEAELFVNGKSAGVKQRKSADFPAAGLHWNVKLNEGKNTLRAVGKRDGVEVSDEISVEYQTKKWGKPSKLTIAEVAQKNGVSTLEARAFDKDGVACLDAANLVRFGLIGDGRLLDNLGTSTGSRAVQLYNGRAQIDAQLTGKVSVSISSEGMKPVFKYVTNTTATVTSDAPKSTKPTSGKSSDKSKKSSTSSTKKVASAGAAAGAVATATLVVSSGASAPAPKLTLDVAAIDRERIMKAAAEALKQKPVTITAFPAKLSQGGPNDFYSNGDYWWPDPSKPDGLPYIRRDGETNPENFSQHRFVVKALRDSVAALAAAYKLTGEERYVTKAAELLRGFFLDPKTRMNPNLNFAQAVPGVSPGRGIGIIDTLHIIEIPAAVKTMEKSKAFPAELAAGLRQWFRELAEWMITSKNGKEEAAAKNNHSVAFHLQLAVFANFTRDEVKLALCRKQFKEVFVPKQMAADGGFPLELARTKPYGYSIFQLDNMTMLCHVLSTEADNLWTFETPDGRGIRKAVAFLYPFLADKSKWTLKPDVQAWEGWPARQPHLLFAGLALGEPKYLDLWKKLTADPTDPEVQRNIGITQPVLWVK